MSVIISSRNPKVLTYKKRVGLGRLCKLLRREWLPSVVHESIQDTGVDSKKGSSIFVWLLAKSLALISLTS
jgi:hypothetical protein